MEVDNPVAAMNDTEMSQEIEAENPGVAIEEAERPQEAWEAAVAEMETPESFETNESTETTESDATTEITEDTELRETTAETTDLTKIPELTDTPVLTETTELTETPETTQPFEITAILETIEITGSSETTEIMDALEIEEAPTAVVMVEQPNTIIELVDLYVPPVPQVQPAQMEPNPVTFVSGEQPLEFISLQQANAMWGNAAIMLYTEPPRNSEPPGGESVRKTGTRGGKRTRNAATPRRPRKRKRPETPPPPLPAPPNFLAHCINPFENDISPRVIVQPAYRPWVFPRDLKKDPIPMKKKVIMPAAQAPSIPFPLSGAVTTPTTQTKPAMSLAQVRQCLPLFGPKVQLTQLSSQGSLRFMAVLREDNGDQRRIVFTAEQLLSFSAIYLRKNAAQAAAVNRGRPPLPSGVKRLANQPGAIKAAAPFPANFKLPQMRAPVGVAPSQAFASYVAPQGALQGAAPTAPQIGRQVAIPAAPPVASLAAPPAIQQAVPPVAPKTVLPVGPPVAPPTAPKIARQVATPAAPLTVPPISSATVSSTAPPPNPNPVQKEVPIPKPVSPPNSPPFNYSTVGLPLILKRSAQMKLLKLRHQRIREKWAAEREAKKKEEVKNEEVRKEETKKQDETKKLQEDTKQEEPSKLEEAGKPEEAEKTRDLNGEAVKNKIVDDLSPTILATQQY
ncbi:LOW QUALITY PROTEIN: proline-rich protein 36 [Drosophila ficusphila]|uniref:LOW QUALITY PROTEIN: proline-rich protein 36 n=1 Tax=Drosophila ficusphila TaxID=30025 RepID=UPI001C8B000F|nr:LOW QUALITY PROTEIN: proline-rich protein 36 [Drosophila ficusphila]